MDTAKWMYKCRLCGAEFFDGIECTAEKGSRILSDICAFGKDMTNNEKIYGENAVKGMSVPNTTIHKCYGRWSGDMAEGIADLIGFIIERKD